MVRILSLATLGLCLAFAPCLARAAAVSPTVQALAELPPRPQAPVLQPNRAWEDAAAVTLVSLPFTAFWALLGALAVGGASQGRFPPELSTDMLAGAAMVAGGSSLAIGLFSISWGGPSHPASASQP